MLVFKETIGFEFSEIFQDQKFKEREKQLYMYCGLSTLTKANLNVVNFLDIKLNLINCTYRTFRKPNDNPIYTNINSTHPPSIKKQVPKVISKIISKLTSNQEILNNNIRTYSDALKNVDFQKTPVLFLKYRPIYTPTRNTDEVEKPFGSVHRIP